MTDEEVGRGEHILANREDYDVHLHGIVRGRESLTSALSPAREILREDDRHLAETLAERRKSEDLRAREERVARLLDDPETLSELRLRRTKRRAGKRQRKGRYLSRGMNIGM